MNERAFFLGAVLSALIALITQNRYIREFLQALRSEYAVPGPAARPSPRAEGPKGDSLGRSESDERWPIY
jgi:hypothetical protein